MTKILAVAGSFVIFIVIGMMLMSFKPGSVEPGGQNLSHQFTFSFKLEIEDLPEDASDLEIWIPFPMENKYQQVASFEVASDLDYEIYSDQVYGNKIMYFASGQNLPRKIDIKVNFEVARLENRSIGNSSSNLPEANRPDYSTFEASNKLVPLGGIIAREADSVVKGVTDTFEKIETLYRHLTETMQYDKSGDGWGNGDALYACDTRTGNCTDIHSLFISMSRSLGIPARFIIGFPLPEDEQSKSIAGYHCWAEFYIDGRGWIPVDISEAIKHPDKKEYYFGHLDLNRISFTMGRDIKLEAKHGPESLNFLVYPYVLVNGKLFDKIAVSFDYKRI